MARRSTRAQTRLRNIRRATENFTRRELPSSTPVRRVSVARSFTREQAASGRLIPYRFTRAKRYVPREAPRPTTSPLELVAQAARVGQLLIAPRSAPLGSCQLKLQRRQALFANKVAGRRGSAPGGVNAYKRSGIVCGKP